MNVGDKSPTITDTPAVNNYDELNSLDNHQNVVDKALKIYQAEMLWGAEPEYTPGAEDRASIFQQLYYGWVGDFIYKAAQNNITEADLPQPTRENRTYNTGRKLSHQINTDIYESKRWTPWIGCEVQYQGEMETIGVLKWVGYLIQSDHPRRLLAGVEWEIAPRYRRNRPFKNALHNGTVHGAVLFQPSRPSEDNPRCSLEGVDRVILLSRNGRTPPPPPVTPNVLKALFKAHGKHVWMQLPPKLIADGCGLLVPVLIEQFVNFLQDDDATWVWGLVLTFLFLIVSSAQSCANHKYDHIGLRAAAIFEVCSFSILFEKCMTISPKSLSVPEMSLGRIMNMAGNDVENIGLLNWYVVYFVTAPLQLCISLLMLFRLVGWPALGGVAVLFFTFPAQSVIYKWQQKLREKMATVVDNRLKRTNEFLSGIRIVKFMGWEPRFLSVIENIREQELQSLRKIQWTYVCNIFVDDATPILVISVVFILYHLAGNELAPNVVFPVITLLNIMRLPFFMIPIIIGTFLQCLVSVRRVTAFLECEDADKSSVGDISRIFKGGVSGAFDGATIHAYVPRALPKCVSTTKSSLRQLLNSLKSNPIAELEFKPIETESDLKNLDEKEGSGESPEVPQDDDDQHVHQLTTKDILFNLNVIIPKGELTMVVGATGSGKSTFLSSLLGEFGISAGRVYANSGNLAYVPQISWIMNASIRDNVLFFEEEDSTKLSSVLTACQLDTDLKLMKHGLDTEIGEKGINLSGGQKARLNLARAVYADRETYLMDDPLSALDAHVGQKIFHELILTKLSGKTRVLVTHQIHFLPFADNIVELDKGKVVFCGSYTDYEKRHANLQTQPAAAHDEEKTSIENEDGENGDEKEKEKDEQLIDNTDANTTETTERRETVQDEDDCGKLMTTEEKAIGNVPWSTYKAYIKYCGGLRGWGILMVVYIITELILVSISLWLSLWSTNTFGLTTNTYFYVYLGLVSFSIFCQPLRGYLCYYFFRQGCRNMHRDLLRSIGIATLTFFDTTPLGRLLNRFSRDVGSIDEELMDAFMSLFSYMFTVSSTIGIMVFAQPLVIFPILLCMFFYFKIMKVYNSCNRETRRIKSIAHSPVLTLLEESLSGKGTIAVFDKAHVIMKNALQLLDVVYKALYMANITNRWLGVRLEFLSCIIISAVALCGVIGKMADFGLQSTALVSLSLTTALTLTESLNWLVRQIASVEANMNSAERILHYINEVEHEELDTIDKDIESMTVRSAEVGSPASPVPPGSVRAGRLEFRDVQMRYREGLPLVLDHVNFVINAGEKVGIVGRTGSGKSTLLLTFMRMVDICGGEILVNGQAIRSLGLRDLRRHFSMIPQDPVLFDGTVRMNVDPFLQASSAEVLEALETVGLKERIASEPEGIDGRVLEGGSNFSVGQRQLLCMARALLKKGSGFILMDEATANIDQALDRHIQNTVMRAFAQYTVITIAHRLQTVARYDKIIVMDHGVVAEMGSPRALVSNTGSLFRRMVDSMGKKAAEDFKASIL